MNPLVSCIVPVYNGERFLAETLDSILAQTYQPLEIIFVDDGSTDDTRAIVEGYGDRVRYLPQEHRGIAATCNIGLRAAHGDFISFHDADDLWLPDKTEKQLALLNTRPQVGGCVCMVQNFWTEEMHADQVAMRNHRHAQPLPGYVLHALLARRETFQEIGYFDESYNHASKTAWFLEAELRGIQIEMLPEVLALRRIHGGNYSQKNASESQQEYLRVMKQYRDRVRAKQK